jgi:hypothetical protein
MLSVMGWLAWRMYLGAQADENARVEQAAA